MRNNFHDLLIISSCQCSLIIIHSRGITRNTYSLAQTPILAYNLIIILQNLSATYPMKAKMPVEAEASRIVS